MAPAGRKAPGHRRDLDSTARTTGRALPIPPPPAAARPRPSALAAPPEVWRRKAGPPGDSGGREREASGASPHALFPWGAAPRDSAPYSCGPPAPDGAALPHLPAPSRPPWAPESHRSRPPLRPITGGETLGKSLTSAAQSGLSKRGACNYVANMVLQRAQFGNSQCCTVIRNYNPRTPSSKADQHHPEWGQRYGIQIAQKQRLAH